MCVYIGDSSSRYYDFFWDYDIAVLISYRLSEQLRCTSKCHLHNLELSMMHQSHTVAMMKVVWHAKVPAHLPFFCIF